jgi:CheY-like chemotaxis protein
MQDAKNVLISVADTGVGIAPEDQGRIFEEFEQVEGPHQLKAKGTGLGLPLAKSLAELLGGSVMLTSSRGVGSTFSVLLPVRFGSPEAGTTHEEPIPAKAGKKVLIVDDDEASRYLLKNLISEQRCEISEASGGLEGLRRAIAEHPDLIILDLGLPDLDGRAVLRELKSNSETAQIPVIINTSKRLSRLDLTELNSLAIGVVSKNETGPNQTRQALFELFTGLGITK